MKNNKYPRGSEWRKWDLHVHTPIDHEWINKPNINFSKSLDEIKDDLELFSKEFIEFAKNEALDVLAIVDHNFCNNIEKSYLPFIINEAKQNNIAILPGFEITVTDGSGIHILVIFKENTDLQKIHEIVKQCFKPGEKLTPDSGQVPISNKSIDQLKELLNKSGEEYLLAFAHADRDNGVLDKNTINGGRRVQEWQKDFINIAQISKKPSEFNSGFMKSVIEKTDQYYSRDITYIIASDCRRIDKSQVKEERTYLGQKFVWVKADPTFEGLKQIIYEAKGRVSIQEKNPLDTKKHWKLNKIIIKDSKIDIFPDQEIVFNPYLTSVIGGRATGKSALVKIIAFINGYGYGDSFIQYLKEKEKNIEINFNFIDSDNNEKNYKITNFEDKNEALPIYYLSQEEIEKFSDESKKEYHEREFLSTIGITNTSHYYINEKEKIENTIEKLRNIDEYEKSFRDYIQKLATERKINFPANIDIEKQAQFIIDNLKKEKDKYSTKSTKKAIEEISKRVRIANKIKEIQESDKIQKIKIQISEVNTLIKEYNEKINDDDFADNDYINAKKDLLLYDEVGLSKKISSNDVALEKYLKKLREESMPYVNVLKNAGIDYKTIQQSIESLDKTIWSLETKKERYKINENSKGDILNKIIDIFKSYENSIEISESDIQTKFEDFVKDRGELFETIFNEIIVTPERYLAKIKLKNKFKSYCYSGKDNHFKNFFDDLQSTNYFEKFDISFLKEVINKKDFFKIETGGYYSIIKLIYSDFIDNYLQIRPKIEFEGKELGGMSGGQQATLMLKLKLASEGIKKDIIILDQPENHLDNKFINEHLVELIKLLKQHKQVIIVSHNANVVVLSDSEEVIIAKMDDEQDKAYISGSIENGLINNTIINILEGGEEAFEKRKNKYNFN